jgi:hypothetical protein
MYRKPHYLEPGNVFSFGIANLMEINKPVPLGQVVEITSFQKIVQQLLIKIVGNGYVRGYMHAFPIDSAENILYACIYFCVHLYSPISRKVEIKLRQRACFSLIHAHLTLYPHFAQKYIPLLTALPHLGQNSVSCPGFCVPVLSVEL